MTRLPDPEPVDEDLLAMLHERDGLETVVVLESGKRCRVMNIAWGYDAGDHYAHIFTNCSPFVDGFDLEFFFTNEIVRVEDAASRDMVWPPGT